ncbi:MAG: hypothetical protein V7746_12385 [Halioglobus sp.]
MDTTPLLSAVGLAVALLLPWALGCAVTFCLLSSNRRWNGAIVAGHGYLLGILLITALLRIWDAVGLSFNFWALATIAALVTVACWVAGLRKNVSPQRHAQPETRLPLWHLLTVLALLGLIILRYLLITQELMLRPLFAWDAWMNWAPKALVWFHFNELTPFINLNDWVYTVESQGGYTLGSWRYPPTVPLIQLWGMLGSGVSDHTTIYLPWLLAPLALSLALYGHLRLAGTPVIVAVLGCYCLLSIPYLNVHTALAGYADIWLFATTGLAAFALHEYSKHKNMGYALLALIMAAGCTQIKIPGIVIGSLLLLVFITKAINPRRRLVLVVLAIAGGTVAVITLVGVQIHIPGIGDLTINRQTISIPHIGSFTLTYHNTLDAFTKNSFKLQNWHLIWYIFIGVAAVKLVRGEWQSAPSTSLLVILGIFLFVGFVFTFTQIALSALDYTGLNRAIMYAVAPTVFYLSHWLGTLGGPARQHSELGEKEMEFDT